MMGRPRKIVMGQYRCGCAYGPVWIKERLTYCGKHGEDIQNEYEVTPYVKPDDLEKAEEEE
jgi:hypothetical protein